MRESKVRVCAAEPVWNMNGYRNTIELNPTDLGGMKGMLNQSLSTVHYKLGAIRWLATKQMPRVISHGSALDYNYTYG